MPKDRFMTEAGGGAEPVPGHVGKDRYLTREQGVCVLYCLRSSAWEGWLVCESFCWFQGQDTQNIVSVLLCVIMTNSRVN